MKNPVERPSKVKYYLDIAAAVAARSTCLRRQYGAVIVKNDMIISTGYNGSARGWINCCDSGSAGGKPTASPTGSSTKSVRPSMPKRTP